MPHTFNRRDLAFQLYEVLEIEKLCDSPRYLDHSKEIFESLMAYPMVFQCVANLKYYDVSLLFYKFKPNII